MALSYLIPNHKHDSVFVGKINNFRDDSHFVDIPSFSLRDFLDEASTWSGFRTYCEKNDGGKVMQEFSSRYVSDSKF